MVWSEGMYLGPQHFQAQSRYFEDSVHFASSVLDFKAYGFAGFELDGEAIRNGTVALAHARGLFPDGLAFHMPEFDPLPKAQYIADQFPPTGDVLDVCLAVPSHKVEGLNCAVTDPERHGGVRYQAESKPMADENTGRDVKPIPFARKNVRFLVSTEAAEGLVTLPLARIKRSTAGGFVYDDKFIPPCLEISASERLMLMLRRLIDILEQKAHTVARPKDLGSPTAAGFSAEGIANAWFLHCVNSCLAPLRHLWMTKRPHPEELYVEMARLAGALCTFSMESHPGGLPLYDHDHMAEVFEVLERHVLTHLELVVPSNRVDIALEKAANYFWAGKILDERTLGRARWILGIYSRIGEAELIERTPRLVKVCSKEFIPKLVERALPGLTLRHLQTPPPAVSPKVEFQYFSIDKVGPCWEHMVKTRELGLYVPGELPEPVLELSVILES